MEAAQAHNKCLCYIFPIAARLPDRFGGDDGSNYLLFFFVLASSSSSSRWRRLDRPVEGSLRCTCMCISLNCPRGLWLDYLIYVLPYWPSSHSLSLFPFVCSSTFTFDTHPTIPRRHPTRRRSRTYPRGESQHRGEGFFCVLLGKVSGEREPLDKSTTRLVVVSLAFILVATGGFFSSYFLLSSCCATKFRVL